MDEIRDAIAAEKKIREESDATLLELFGEMGTKIQTELDNSREERNISHPTVSLACVSEVLPQLEMARLNRNDNMREKLKLQGDAPKHCNAGGEFLQAREISRTAKQFFFGNCCPLWALGFTTFLVLDTWRVVRSHPKKIRQSFASDRKHCFFGPLVMSVVAILDACTVSVRLHFR